VQGVKEIKELIAALEVVGVAAKKISADGKINALDIPHAIEALMKVQVVVDGIAGLDQIPAEIKDLSAPEAQEILQALIDAVAKVKAA
jgi:hypothetical protein